MRSTVAPRGRSPTSSRKRANDDRHRSHTAMPRAPYAWNHASSGLWHRCTIWSQTLYRGVLDWPCVVFDNDRLQPHDVVLPARRASLRVVKAAEPQLHCTSQKAILRRRSPAGIAARRRTISIPNVSPERSTNFPMLRTVLALALVATVACSSSPPPAPNAPDEPDAAAARGSSARCEKACARLSELGCPEARPTSSGESCPRVCLKALELRPLPLECWAGAGDVPSARGCGSLRCGP